MSKIDAISGKLIESEVHAPVQGSRKLPKTTRRHSVPTSDMVDAAIKSQMSSSRRGVSLAAIKKYIVEHYQMVAADLSQRQRFIKKYIMDALRDGKLVRTTGTGISGSFRLPSKRAGGVHKSSLKAKERKQTSKGKKVKAIKVSEDGKQLAKTISKLSLKKETATEFLVKN